MTFENRVSDLLPLASFAMRVAEATEADLAALQAELDALTERVDEIYALLPEAGLRASRRSRRHQSGATHGA